ncbi:MAG: DUF3667 domain-containing protein [Gammaproteobacteria bacterium]|nr:DUF3667 domain-containing protein [Gammaproteobacteria bacterium]
MADPEGHAETESGEAAAPEPARRRGRHCDNCGARLRGRFCSTCGQRDPSYDRIVCENCGAEKQGLYCAVCGQNDRNYRRTVFPVVGEFLAETFETDSRLFRTARVMFTRPGLLSTEFSRNRRAGYLSPFRLYLFTSIVFFFVLSVSVDLPDGPLPPPDAAARDGKGPREGPLRGRPGFPGQAGVDSPSTDDGPPPNVAEKPSAAEVPPSATVEIELGGGESGESGLTRGPGGVLEMTPELKERVDWFKGLLDDSRQRKLDQILRRPLLGDALASGLRAITPGNADAVGGVSRYVIGQLIDVLHRPWDAVKVWFENLPVAMFCLLPIYALLLKVMFLGNRRYYSEHLVFAMHIHTVAYLMFTVMVLVPDNAIGPWVNLVSLLALAVYYFMALKRYYDNGVFATLVKSGLLGAIYSGLLVVTLIGAAAAVLLLF